MTLALKSLIFTSLFLISSNLYSADYALFTNGEPVANYNDIVRTLKQGDMVSFSNGQRFSIKGLLGKGNTTWVYELEDGRAIRLPLSSSLEQLFGLTYRDYITQFIYGAESLQNNGVPTVGVAKEESLLGEYAIVEKLEILYTLSGYLKARRSLYPVVRSAIDNQLVDFAIKTYKYETIGDMHDEQIAYTTRGWVFFDFTNRHVRALNLNSSTIISWGASAFAMQMHASAAHEIHLTVDRLNLPQELHKAVYEGITRAREASGMTTPKSCFSLIIDGISRFLKSK